MILESAAAICSYLEQQRHFAQCILEDLCWRHYGTVLELVFDYIWTDEGDVRPEYAGKNIKTMVLRNVQELHMWNALNEHMTLHPDDLNWGLSEVAAVRLIEDDTLLANYAKLSVPFHHLGLRWEGDRRVDVIFGTMETA